MSESVNDEAVIYQLEKVDQAGAVMDLFEDQLERVASAFGYDIEEDVDHPHCGEIKLPDGRYAGLSFEAYITGKDDT